MILCSATAVVPSWHHHCYWPPRCVTLLRLRFSGIKSTHSTRIQTRAVWPSSCMVLTLTLNLFSLRISRPPQNTKRPRVAMTSRTVLQLRLLRPSSHRHSNSNKSFPGSFLRVAWRLQLRSFSSAPPPPPDTDDPPTSWVEEYLPVTVQPYARLARMDKPIGTFLLLWPCWWSTALAANHALPDPKLLALFGVGTY